MRYLDLTLPSLAENLALDEALLDEAETAAGPLETLRFWESREVGVVMGRSSALAEVQAAACRQMNVSILRRISGGAAVVVGPGCLLYALVLNLRLRPEIRSIDRAHAHVLGAIIAALRPAVPALSHCGTCDLAVGQRKISGNSVRLKRDHLLYHGTLLYDFPLELIGRYLAMPPRQPDYRQARPHAAFVANLPLEGAALRAALRTAWAASEPCGEWPRDRVAALVAEKYSRPEWNLGTR